MTAVAPHRYRARTGRDGFGRLVHAEWTKLRTVRGWVIGIVLAPVLIVALGYLYSSATCSGAGPDHGCPAPAVGPGSIALIDTYYFAHQALAGNGTITARMTSLTGEYSPNGRGLPANGTPGGRLKPGVQPWRPRPGSWSGAAPCPGSAYTAMLVTGGKGVRMQWNYRGIRLACRARCPPRRRAALGLTRSGDTITGYDSTDGTHWTELNRVVVNGLPSTAQMGLNAACAELPAARAGRQSLLPKSAPA